MPGQDYRSWNAKAPRATPAARLRLMPPRKPHRGFRAGVVATPKRKHAKYSEGFLITLVAARFGCKMRTWMRKTRDVLLPQSSVSCSTTVYVGIGNIHAGPHFMLGRSTNSTDFRRFLEELRWARTDNMDADYFLILDGKFHNFKSFKVSRGRAKYF